MFDLEKVKNLNELEMVVYEYVLSHLEVVQKLTIRELSQKSHVSTTTILKMCNKLGFEGYSEFKYVIKEKVKLHKNQGKGKVYDSTIEVDHFLKKVNQEDYSLILEEAVEYIVQAEHLLFTGTGTSHILGQYGSRYFLNLGMNAHSVSDPFAPVPKVGLDTTLVIVLSVSGETSEVIRQIQWFKEKGVMVLSVTNNEHSTLAHLANCNISYYMPEIRNDSQSMINLTTQVPVIMILELLAHRASNRLFR